MANNTWVCEKCSEIIEQQFDQCWNCGSSTTISEENKHKITDNNSIEYYGIKENNRENEISFDIKIRSLKTFQFVLLCINLLGFLGFIVTLIAMSSTLSSYGEYGILIGAPFIIMFLGLCVAIYINNKLILMVDVLFYLKQKTDKIEEED